MARRGFIRRTFLCMVLLILVFTGLYFMLSKTTTSSLERMSNDDNLFVGASPHSQYQPRTLLLTLFTTFDVSDTFRTQIYKNTITLWPQLGPGVRLILFVCDEIQENNDFIQLARQLNWEINTTVCEKELHLPFFRRMFLAAQKLQDSTFYAYANADMLFDMSLVGSLAALKTGVLEEVLAQRSYMLAFGARTMIEVGKKRTINTLAELRNITTNEGTFFTVAGVDYFIATRGDYPWTEFPDFVVSRVVYDSWTINLFVRKDFPTFDLTDTVVAAHQCDGRPVLRTRSNDVKNVEYNLKLIDKDFCWRDGMATCSKYKTRMTPDHSAFQIWERTKKGFCGNDTGVTMNQTHYLSMMQKEEAKLFLNVALS